MCNSNVSHLPTKIAAKDHEKQFPDVLHESGGKLFCTPCNIVVEYKRKSSIEKHFTTAKHIKRMAEMSRLQTRQTTLTEAVAPRSVASTERMKVSWVATCTAVNIPLSKSDHPAMRRFLKEKVINGGAIPGFHQLQEMHVGAVYEKEK
uniref:CGG triplet repeat binding protein 1 n=1 Tax=Amphiprion percula TaxID=161767 RepID=A0A3P8TRL5_AMPPE